MLNNNLLKLVRKVRFSNIEKRINNLYLVELLLVLSDGVLANDLQEAMLRVIHEGAVLSCGVNPRLGPDGSVVDLHRLRVDVDLLILVGLHLFLGFHLSCLLLLLLGGGLS